MFCLKLELLSIFHVNCTGSKPSLPTVRAGATGIGKSASATVAALPKPNTSSSSIDNKTKSRVSLQVDEEIKKKIKKILIQNCTLYIIL